MHSTIHINRHVVEDVRVKAHPDLTDLISLVVTEGGKGSHRMDADLTMDREFWQRAVDQLAGLGVVAGVTLARLAADQRPPTGYVAPTVGGAAWWNDVAPGFGGVA